MSENSVINATLANLATTLANLGAHVARLTERVTVLEAAQSVREGGVGSVRSRWGGDSEPGTITPEEPEKAR